MLNDLHAWIDTCLEAAILWILIKEFNYDKEKYERQAERNRNKKAKKDKGLDTSPIPNSSGKKDLAVEPGQNAGIKESADIKNRVEMRALSESSGQDRLHNKEGEETPQN